MRNRRRAKGGRGGAGVVLLALLWATGCGQGTDDSQTVPSADADVPDGPPPPAQCTNGADDDGDGRIDFPDDPGCEDGVDDDESDDPGEPPAAQCANGMDDDGDGRIDYPDDAGCTSPEDDDEGDERRPECGDGEDNDDDGLTDFPRDPGCASAADDRESDDVAPGPQCADGIDNDRDGAIDLVDPGCEHPGDPREQDPEEPAACSNGLDDDEDGLVDFPAEPGCSAAGDDDEADPDPPAFCANGADDDGDGLVDYPEDPGCVGVGDRDETDPPGRKACSDGEDNDRDGAIDFPDDHGCVSAADDSELGSCGTVYDAPDVEDGRTLHVDLGRGTFKAAGSCGGQGSPELVFAHRVEAPIEALRISTEHPDTAVETVIYVRRDCLDEATEVACGREPLDDGVTANTLRVEAPEPGDYIIFVDGAAGRGGPVALTIEEVPLAQCRNELDDDEDGRTDFPFDPGCTDREDRDETDPPEPPACANGEDDDGDGLVDFPNDVGCRSAVDDDEVDVCGQGVPVERFPVGDPFVTGTTVAAGSRFGGSCGGANGNEVIYVYSNPFNARLRFSVDHEETAQTTTLYVRTDCVLGNTELGCDTGRGAPARGTVRIERAPPGDYYVFVDTPLGAGPFKLSVQVDRLAPGCSDGHDGDGDGFVDGDDPGCASAEDEDERDPPPGAPAPACHNGRDDDEDGHIDYPFDPGCATKGGLDEADPEPPPACSNGIDDDEDRRTDFPDDAGCQSRGDDDERNPLPAPACGNVLDDDGDGRIDYPFDPGCDAAGDRSEQDTDPSPACFNELDDDRDGLVDFPFDPGCAAASDRSEVDPEERPVCGNGVDDDGDGRIDYPRDPGCLFAADGDETDPAFPPQCANGRDDDRDNRIDWPDDPGCADAADTDEQNEGPVRPRCSDGIDNDDDATIDLADVGCEDARDDDETDPAEVPFCADGVDNDGDGAADWPDDDGCPARGAECEQPGHARCDGVCIDVTADAQNCGRCGRVCDEGVECIDGFCGGLFVFEGILEDVPEEDLGGWVECHRSLYRDREPLAPILAACDGEYVMLGCRPVGSPTYELLAMGERDEVFEETVGQDQVNVHNGVGWYFSTTRSMGFAPPNERVRLFTCDVENSQAHLRMCWHTSGGRLSSGYRCGDNSRQGWLNGSATWERVIFTTE